MDTLPDHLRGLVWYYIGDKQNGASVVMTPSGDFLYLRPNTMVLIKEECYKEAADCRLDFESTNSTMLQPLYVPPVRQGVTARFGMATVYPTELSSLVHLCG